MRSPEFTSVTWPWNTETTLLKVRNDILMTEYGFSTLDFVCAIGPKCSIWLVDHDVLLNRLSTSFGVRGSALRCFASYLPNRSQSVSCDQKLSENFQLDCGVRQGSCLCPLLFMIYASSDLRSLKSTSPKPTHMRVTPNCIFSRLTRHPQRSMQLIPWSIVWMQLDAGWSRKNSVWTMIRRNSS